MNNPCSIFWTKKSKKLFEKFPQNIQEKLKEEIITLRINPLAGYQLRGRFNNLRSLHVSVSSVSYRVIYFYDAQLKEITLHYVSTRENIYKKLQEMKM